MAKDRNKPQKLDELYFDLFKCHREDAHRADNDAMDLAWCFKKMTEPNFSIDGLRNKER